MKTRAVTMSATLSGAALLLLASASPSLADASSKGEREATRQLNLQASQDAQAASIRSMPQMVVTDAAANASGNTPPAAAPTMTVQTAAVNAPTISTDAQAGPATLSSISNPPAKIATANVLDSSGKTVGAVQRVEVSSTGTPTKVTVALVGTKEQLVTLDAASVSYDAGKNEITAQASGEQLKAMSHAG